MLKKLCVAFVGLGLCVGMLGCTSKEAKMPEQKVEPPAAKPTSQQMKVD